MAKKAKKTEVETTPPVVEQPKVETPVMEKPLPKETKSTGPEDGWVIKDRMYYLMGNKSPLSYLVRGSAIYYWDENLGYERELKYTSCLLYTSPSPRD